MAPQVGFEPTTDRLTADCSTTELPRNIFYYYKTRLIMQLLIKINLICSYNYKNIILQFLSFAKLG